MTSSDFESANWDIDLLLSRFKNGLIDLSPNIQRHSVWNEKTQMMLIDSVARRVPMGAITLFKITNIFRRTIIENLRFFFIIRLTYQFLVN